MKRNPYHNKRNGEIFIYEIPPGGKTISSISPSLQILKSLSKQQSVTFSQTHQRKVFAKALSA
jgi:hypothetical protein